MNPDRCIFFQLSKASQVAVKFLGQKVAPLSITPVQAMVLGFLHEEDQLAAGELGKKTELDSATLTGILDRLASAQLIERQGNPGDRRSILIHLTERGREVAAEAVRIIEEANEEFLQELTEAEQSTLHRMIGKVRRPTRGSSTKIPCEQV